MRRWGIFTRGDVLRLFAVMVLSALLVNGISAIAGAAGMAQRKERLTLESIFGGGFPDPAPSEVRWAPDGSRFACFLEGNDRQRELWTVDIPNGRKTLILSAGQAAEMAPSPDQASLSEREQTRRNRYGIPSYVWSPDGTKLLLVSSGRLYLYDLRTGTTDTLAPSRSGLLDPEFSPDGKWVSFLLAHDIWIVPSAGGKERQLTFGGSDVLLHGEPDWLYQEELAVHSGYRWSPDSRRIAFLELDEREVPSYPLVQEIHLQASVDWERYPKPGEINPKARVGIVDIETAAVVWSERESEYVADIVWADAAGVMVQLMDRAQKTIDLVEVDPATGKGRTLLTEQDTHWLNVSKGPTFFSEGKHFLWLSERTGFRHIYRYERDGRLSKQLTSGEWVVNGIEGVDEKNGWVYYSSNEAANLGRDLFRRKLDGSGAERLTKEQGTHATMMNPPATALVDSFSSYAQAPVMTLHDLASGAKSELARARGLEEEDRATSEIRELRTPDGALVRVQLHLPRKLDSKRKHPVVVYAYGMPGFPTIQDVWPGSRGLFHQFLVQQGFVVALVDDRSSSLRGHRYEVAAYHNVGPLAAQDHKVAVDYLNALPYVKKNAIGIWGWSGGGFTAAYHMTHTDLFKAGVAGAPVTDWRLYDTVYTERYMGTPNEDPGAYLRTSTVAAAADYRGSLLLIHGTQDDNVHPQNTIQLIHALIKSRKQFELMLYPDKTHGITGADENVHLHTMIYRFLKRNL